MRHMRMAGYALAILFLSLSAFTAAMAQSPDRKYGFCHGLAGNPRVNNYTKVFVLGPASPPGAMSGFLQYLHKRYAGYTTPELRCQTYATPAEAEAEYRKLMADIAPHAATWPLVEIDWIPEGGYLLGGKPPPAAAAPAAPKPAAPAPTSPAPATAAARPAAPAPAKPATAASKPGVYVICRAEWNNRDARRFYNPPVDGRGAGYAEWQASWREYLVKQHGFKGSNAGCGKYTTGEAAQADYDTWVTNARATPAVNGQDSPIVITNWKY